ncbi:hypothetical protein GLP43_15005 [Sulfitobacter sp. M39]|uniref:DUF192 domain-containing protein n=1 Tax=Sulfitobacter sp. M39 TaxID=2675334 RepID=UPI001F4703EB|nr:DUF192 domain-containing protein [Sulfitobacter sp. M39]MCF7748873.1 hypothetical protein [Sulfitobacter sp. M39]
MREHSKRLHKKQFSLLGYPNYLFSRGAVHFEMCAVVVSTDQSLIRLPTIAFRKKKQIINGLSLFASTSRFKAALFVLPVCERQHFGMNGMSFDLDIHFFDTHGRLVSSFFDAESGSAQSYSSGDPARYALEIPCCVSRQWKSRKVKSIAVPAQMKRSKSPLFIKGHTYPR